ncbi:protein-disulfide reductase DsbD family protein [Flavobacterium urumqiense]|uniref:Thiol:disulfide interchange protein DsbD n=1 Tax=Flavobacterium urumqiense TaxID=935224 RepID=A0A1H6AJ70_9FLAO|nr:cytochrome c biogenesis protein CcdA [Flavobacterium urumqiense]SEG48280.1 thiol:disulfide interchange protein DsbD [Flavobacterium urumqiense]
MRKIIFLLLVFLAFAKGNAQILDPAKWTTKIEKKSENTYLLTFNAVIEKDWHMYSQFTPDGGPLALEVIFKNQKGNFTLVGKAKESKTTTAFNDVFGVNETFFHDKAQIQQQVIITNPKLTTIEVDLNYQVCKEACINLEKKFTFAIPSPLKNSVDAVKKEAVVTDSVRSDSTVVKTEVGTATVIPAKVNIPDANPVNKRGLWSIFFIAFFSGFAALLTPCVFPMIPMTVSFFTKQSKSRAKGIKNALIYGVSIIFIYVVLGFLVTWIFGAGALNALSTNVWFNIIFFLLLIVFAFSFLGAFEIMLPQSWANKVDSQADRGGIVGILFMALALAIVSFSCTGPIVGTLLVEAASKGGIAPIIGMFGFSLALALPFMLFAMFPGWLHSLPKSGGWLNTVKVVLGFLELALAFKFLSNADLVLQLHLLEREVFLAIWIAVFGTLAFYLFGKITLPHDSPLPHISVGRLAFGLVVLIFTIYLIPGLWGAPLKLINAFPPPMEYSESPMGFVGSGVKESAVVLPDGAKSGPHGLVVFDDYEKGLAYAKTVNKPIMLDFTGYACVNCRKMENNVWSADRVLSQLKNEVVLISLYVDDKRELPKEEQFVSKTTGAEIETTGDKWTDFMISKYKTNTQPLYVLTDLEGKSLNEEKPTISYVGVDEYASWLKIGISQFKK